MSDINKVVAAILTSGRVPTLSKTGGSREMDDWLAEYNAWVEALDKQDEGTAKAEAGTWGRGMLDALKDENNR